jgi:hypothetical protein
MTLEDSKDLAKGLLACWGVYRRTHPDPAITQYGINPPRGSVCRTVTDNSQEESWVIRFDWIIPIASKIEQLLRDMGPFYSEMAIRRWIYLQGWDDIADRLYVSRRDALIHRNVLITTIARIGLN